MLLVKFQRIETLDDATELLQMAIELEFSTLPPYLYALHSIRPDANAVAAGRIQAVAMEEMVHMCLACNILNALGTSPTITAATYPGPLPGGITGGGEEPLIIHLYPFSKDAMAQAMAIEEPEGGPIDFPHELALEAAPTFMTIGQFYNHLDSFLATLQPEHWAKGRNQIDDLQFSPVSCLQSTATKMPTTPSSALSRKAKAPRRARSISRARSPITIASPSSSTIRS